MKHSIYTSYDELPLMLSVAEVAAVLGISRAGAYELVHGNEFPALKIGSRIVVPKDKVLHCSELVHIHIEDWLGRHMNKRMVSMEAVKKGFENG